MSEGYPGEHSAIPKRAAESLKYQPLNHIIPKSLISRCATSVIEQELVINRADSFPEPPSDFWQYSNSIELDAFDDNESDPLIFKRPTHLQLASTETTTSTDAPLLKRLSKLPFTNLVDSNQILNAIENSTQRKLKKKRPNNSIQPEITISNNTTKKLKNGAQMIALNQIESGQKCITEFEQLVKELSAHEQMDQAPNAEFWMYLNDEEYILKSQVLEKLSLIINKILSFATTGERINESVLKELLTICVSTMKIVLKTKEANLSHTLDSTGLLCSQLILEILMTDIKKYSLQLEEYYSVAFDYIDTILTEVENEDPKSPKYGDIFIGINSFVSLLLKFVNKQPFLDENFITRTICSSTELLLSKTYHSFNSNILINLSDRIRETSIEIIAFIFKKFKSQRIFVLEEILSKSENLPPSRSPKKLKQLELSELFASHFTIAIVRMLQTINIFQTCAQVSILEDESIGLISEELKENKLGVDELVMYISSYIFEKAVQNFPKFRFIMDSYFQDLLNMIDNPAYSSSVLLFTSMQTKIFQVFKSQNTTYATVEPFALHLTGLAAARLLEVRLASTNISSKTLNYETKSEYQKHHFELCTYIIYTLGETSERSSDQYRCFWNSTLEYYLDLRSTASNTESVKNIDRFLKDLLEIASHDPERRTNKQLDYKDLQKKYSEVLLCGRLFEVYEPSLKLILSLLNQSKIKLKSGAIKCLSLLVSKDQNLLSSPIVDQTIKSRLSDSSASVRDAILDFLESSSSFCQFYREINNSFDDDSASIRKHILKMNEKIYDSTKSFEIKAFVLDKILKRTEDEEDTIIESARTIMLERLVFFVPKDETDAAMIEQRTNEIISILKLLLTYGEKTTELLEFFFHFYVLNKKVHESEEFQRIKNSIEILTENLVQRILDQKSKEYDTHETLFCMLELLLFVALFPGIFITKNQLSNLLPYLISDENSKSRYFLLKIFRCSVKKISNLKQRFIKELETCLLSKITKFNTKEIDEAMSLCWDLADKSRNYNALSKVCTACISQLKPYAIKAVKNPETIKSDGKIQRLLYISTAFARICRFKENAVGLPFLRNDEHIFEYVAKCLLGFTNPNINANLRRIAIKNLVRLATSFPRLFNARPLLELMDKEFSDGTVTIKLTIIECLHEFISTEEKKALLKTGVNGTVSSNKELRRLISTQNSTESVNDGVCSALVSRYLDSILEIVLHPNSKEAVSALNFLKLILTLNYVNPAPTVPTLVALSCSHTKYFKTTSMKLLSQIFEQYESMVFNGVSLGIKKCISYLKSINHSKFYLEDSCIHDIQTLLSNNKKNTKKFYLLTKAIFTSECSKMTSENNDILLFMTANMTKVSYADQLELYTVISALTPICEELEETIQDILSVRDDDSKYEKAFNLLVRKTIIDNFKQYMFENAHLSTDKVVLVGTPDELSLKGKNIAWKRLPGLVFDEEVFLKPSSDQMKQICDDFVEKCENDY